MFDRIFTNWKTTVAGVVLGFGQYLVAQGSHGFTWESFFAAVGSIVLGAIAKDK